MIEILAELTKGGEFNSGHVKTNKAQLHSKEIRYPKRYNKKILSKNGMRLLNHCVLVKSNQVKTTGVGEFSKNIVWAGGVNPRKNDIEKSLKEHGFQLKHTPIALYTEDNETYFVIDGATRFNYLRELDHQNIIADIYTRREGADDMQVEIGVGLIQTQSNLDREVAGKVTDKDIIVNLHNYMKRGHIPCNNLNEPSLVHTIGFVEKFYEGHVKHQKKIERLAKRAVDTYAQNTKRLVWADSKDVEDWLGRKSKASSKNLSSYFDNNEDLADDFGTKQAIKGSKNKFVDIPPQYDSDGRVTPGIKYLILDTSQARRSVASVCRALKEHPDTEIRMIIYLKQVTDYENPVAQFNSEINGFIDDYYSQINDIRVHLFNGAPVIGGPVIYGALPSLESAHNIEELIFLDPSTKQWYQKNPKIDNVNNISSFDLLNSIHYTDVVASTNDEEEEVNT